MRVGDSVIALLFFFLLPRLMKKYGNIQMEVDGLRCMNNADLKKN